MALVVPSVEIANRRNTLGVWRPDSEIRARDFALSDDMSAEFLPEIIVRALVEKMQVVRRQQADIRGNVFSTWCESRAHAIDLSAALPQYCRMPSSGIFTQSGRLFSS